MTENEISFKVIGALIEVHRELGPGLLESCYEVALKHEFDSIGLQYQRQFPIPFYYKGSKMEAGFRADFLIEEKVILELKCVEMLSPVHFSQVLTYLRISNKKLGLLVNFNCKIVKNQIRRIANGL
ncbi:MAG: GxxExxY protein [Saprospiraceae bacterium]